MEYMKHFAKIACMLSPENLTCDGELSREEVEARLADLRKQWAALQRKYNVRVSLEEAEAYLYDSYRRA